ncbi:MAG: manganese efflux pump MntP family protein [Methanomassiliicoccaceae archaeon]|nr:manganese efflux pump MntP family protein [Methanomassiliicoccaceae archaeon]
MGLTELTILAVAVAMDAFAVSICLGLNMKRATLKNALTVGLYFGSFQAGMALIGYLAAGLFAGRIEAYDHWIVFILLSFLGVKMVIGGLRKKEENDEETSLRPGRMLPYAVATSIDALAVGVSLALIASGAVSAIVLIGIVTLVLSMIGVKVGNLFGMRFRPAAEIAGGVILILIGTKILLEHTGII